MKQIIPATILGLAGLVSCTPPPIHVYPSEFVELKKDFHAEFIKNDLTCSSISASGEAIYQAMEEAGGNLYVVEGRTIQGVEICTFGKIYNYH